VMLEPPAQPGATVALGVKDLNLFLDAARDRGVYLTIAEKMQERFEEAIAQGLQDADWAGGMLTAAESAAHPKTDSAEDQSRKQLGRMEV